MQAWNSVRVVLKKFSEDCVISSLLPCQNLQYHMAETSLSSTPDTISIDKLSRKYGYWHNCSTIYWDTVAASADTHRCLFFFFLLCLSLCKVNKVILPQGIYIPWESQIEILALDKGRSLRLSEHCIFFWVKCIIDTGGFALYQKGTWALKRDKTDTFFL